MSATPESARPRESESTPAEVDLRFSLANERTLLAWLRTALALLASGGAIQQLSTIPGRSWLAVCVGAVGVAAALAGGWRFHRTASALRDGRASATVGVPLAMATAVAGIGLGLVVALVVAT